MEFLPFSTQNWSRTFSIWVEDIQVQFQPLVGRKIITGGFLRRVRGMTRFSAPVLVLFFSLHCSRLRSVSTLPQSSAPESKVAEGRIYTETGMASWYGGNGDGFEGRSTASGEVFDPEKLTCAHRTLPFGTLVEVENADSGQRAILRVTDRGPFTRRRVLDVSRKGAEMLGFLEAGTAKVSLRTVDRDGRPVPIDPALDAVPYTIQVAALSDKANLERLKADLEEAFGAVTLQKAMTREGLIVTRVRVGSFNRMEDAAKMMDKIARRFRHVDPFVLRER